MIFLSIFLILPFSTTIQYQFFLQKMENGSRMSWRDWFLSQPFAQYFVKIDDNFLNDTMNYYGIRQKVSNFSLSLEIIKGPYIPKENYTLNWPPLINDYAMILYGLLHAKYLSTSQGLDLMFEKYKQNSFEKCPRSLCQGIQCLPFGNSNDIGNSTLKLFCPNCNDIYHINNEDCQYLDGAFFGNNWVHLFLRKFPSIIPSGIPKKYVPRLFGYQLYGDGTEESIYLSRK